MGLDHHRFKLVLNNYGGREQVKQAKVEAALDMKVFGRCPKTRPWSLGHATRASRSWGSRRWHGIQSKFRRLCRGVRSHLEEPTT